MSCVNERGAFVDGEWVDRAGRLHWHAGLLVDGELRSASGEDVVLVSPRDSRELARVGSASPDDVDLAVGSARAAFDDGRWAHLDPTARGEVLVRFADLVAAHAPDLATRISLEMGKPVREALEVEIPAVARCLRWYGELADKLLDESPVTGPGSLALLTREPAGVVGAVMPWNFPLTMTACQLGPALVAGNSVVLKPAEQTPFSALDLAWLGREAGLPPGVLNVVPGRGPVAGAALGRHPDVDVVAFAGSVPVGRRFLAYSAESNGKRVWLELGGKSATIILPDADVPAAARTTAWACFYNQGQMCSASSRMIVHRDVADEATAAARDQAAAMAPGDPLDWDAPIGAVASEDALLGVLQDVQGALDDGATIAQGSSERYPLGPGSYLAPVILTDVTPDMPIARQEVFGPVLSVLVVDSAQEAVRVANDTQFGLAAGLWTRDLSSAHRLSRQLKAGSVWVNCFGRDKSSPAVDKYTQRKSTWIELAS